MQSLKYDNLSADDFDSAWHACRKHRVNTIFNDCANVADVMKIWPQYKKPIGFKLVRYL